MIKVDEYILVKVINDIMKNYGDGLFLWDRRNVFYAIIQEDKLDLSREHNDRLFTAVERIFYDEEHK